MLGMYILFSLNECVCSLRLQRRTDVPHHGWLETGGARMYIGKNTIDLIEITKKK